MHKLLWLLVPVLLLGLYLGLSAPLADINAPDEPEATESTEQVETAELDLSIYPETIIQGEPARIVVEGLGTSTVSSLTFSGRRLETFEYEGKPNAYVGIDLRAEAGSYPLVLTTDDGRIIRENLVVTARPVVKAPLGIPEKLGGNTPQAESELLRTLAEEGRLISNIPTNPSKLWQEPFRLPVNEPVFITDVYGYGRQTGDSTIAHKGTDFRAPIGTPIYSMNSGEIKFTRLLRNYGNTIIVDHGLGLQTIYMHLSEILVEEGDAVERGELIGLSGDTGYTLGAHLHLTVRINNISIDPMKFLELFGA